MCGARKESEAIRRRRESEEGAVQSSSSEKERKRDLGKGAVQMEKPPLHERRSNGGARPSRKPRATGNHNNMEGAMRRVAAHAGATQEYG